MAEFKEVIEQFNRMCEIYKDTCINCPLENFRGLRTCWRWCFEKPELAENLVMKWAEEHPVKRNYQKFEETFGINPITMDWWNMRGADWLMEEFKEPKNE